MAATRRSAAAITAERDAFLERFLKASGGVIDAATIYIGDRLGYYRALESDGPLTSTQLANATRTHERYAREWLEQQATSGILKVANPRASAEARRYSLPAGHAEVLNDSDSLNYAAPLARLIVSVIKPMDALLEAFRTGGGVPWDAYGADAREGQAAMNRPMFLKQLGQEWIPAMPDVHQRLQASPPARIADVGCGAGWSSIGIAKAFPQVRVDGLDVDEPSIRLARQNAREAGVSDRVKFQVVDGAMAKLRGKYDLVTAFECIHDMSNPVGVLATMRSLLASGGTAFVVDERVADRFMGKGNDVEWMMYGWSVLCCLPAGMADRPTAATGTVMRLPTLRLYAREAGFKSVKKLPLEHFFFSFYRLEPSQG